MTMGWDKRERFVAVDEPEFEGLALSTPMNDGLWHIIAIAEPMYLLHGKMVTTSAEGAVPGARVVEIKMDPPKWS